MTEESSKKRIAVMLPKLGSYGGVEQFAWRLSKALVDSGYSVDFICSRQEAEAPDGVNVRCVGRYGFFRFFKTLWYLIRAEQVRRKGNYDLSISLGKTWNQDIARIGGGPLQKFWELSEKAWEPGFPRFFKRLRRFLNPDNWLTIFIEKHLYTKTPHLVAVSDLVKDWIVEVYPHLRKNPADNGQIIHTMYNCPDLSKFSFPSNEERLEARKVFGIKEGEYALGLATTNFMLKGVKYVIKALPLLSKDVHFHVAGGRSTSYYMGLAKWLGVSDRVHFHGKVKNMRQFYHSLDMFILPTFYDAFGNVVLEAMFCGVKTICSKNVGSYVFLPEDYVFEDPSSYSEIAVTIVHTRLLDEKVELPELSGSGIDEIVKLVGSELSSKG